MDWTERKLTLLRKLAREGRSFGEAAQVLGCTRAAVAGKAYRLRLKFKGNRTPEQRSRIAKLAWDRMPADKRAARLAATAHRAGIASLRRRGLIGA